MTTQPGQTMCPAPMQIEIWPIDRLRPYPRNPRKNDAAVDRMCESIRQFGFKIPCLVRSDGEIVDGHLRLKAARKLGIAEIPVILCDEWTPAQVKAFRLMVNRSVTWADWDETLLALELQEIQEADFDLSLTGFEPGEIDGLLALEDDEKANAAPPLPETPVSRLGDLWLLGPHRVLCGDATSAEAVARLLGERKPRLLVTDPPYGIELDSEWRDRAGLNGCGAAEPSYMKKRTKGTPKPQSPATRGQIGRKRSSWCRASRPLTFGMPVSSLAKFSTACYGSVSSTISRSFGTRVERCSRERCIGSNTNLLGLFERKMRRGSARPARTRRSGRHPHRSSLWAGLTRPSTITRRRNRSS